MPQEVRMWQITDGDILNEISQSKLNLEDRIESWLESDISIISNELIVIGRQVETDFGGIIDLLCLDNNGDLVIIELKRDKTPREITAQILDYASWVKDLGNDRITEIANNYFGNNINLEEAFRNQFRDDLPEIINERHKMLIVASKIDNSSERIIKYLSDSYGVGINAITFHYFQCEYGKEYLSRVYLIEPSEVEYKSRTKTSSKKKPPLTFEELQELAEKNGVGNIYKKALESFSQFFKQATRHRSAVAFKGIVGESKSPNSILVLYLTESSEEKGLMANVYTDRMANYFGYDKDKIVSLLPQYKKEEYHFIEEEVGSICFKSEEDVDNFLFKLSNL